jgi:hypothetical protein
VWRLLSNYRLDSAEQLAWLDRLYTDLLRPFNNCFQPVMHGLGRIQVGERSRRLHDLRGPHSAVSWRAALPSPKRSRV